MLSKQAFFALSLSLLNSSVLAANGTTLFDQLFPSTYTYSSGFTTADVDVGSNIKKVDLAASDQLNIIRGSAPEPVEYSGKKAWHAVYPKGAYAAGGIPEGLNIVFNGTDEFSAACAA